MPFETIPELLSLQKDQHGDNIALLAPDRSAINYRQLFEHCRLCAETLQSMGIGKNNRVAIVLPNGPDMASAFLAVSSIATSAPLNPNYSASECKFYLSDLNAKTLIVQEAIQSPAVEVAQSLNIPILRLQPQSGAGLFSLRLEKPLNDQDAVERIGSDSSKPVQADDIALVLHTSGTTSRPKIVPLSQKNLSASSRHIATTLELHSHDRCLNVMPLFHIHGIMAAAMATFCSAASLVCSPGFLAPKFFTWLEIFEPTWYTAVPTMHQAILARADNNINIIDNTKLRFIRSSSASLAPSVLQALEATFQVPVIEAYGMTEAAHQMASNPMPPLARKAGSVGLAAGPEVAIMDEANTLLPNGEKGEIVIRGDNVTREYDNNPEANASAFCEGWFRTGDQGYMDSEGFLTITGRLKEIINRGGEKISPREIDELLLTHPSVAQAVTFAIEHPRLGEEIAAAVVLVEGASTTDSELRKFAGQHLVDYKVPRQWVIVDKIPTGATGKIQRIGLAKKLGVKAQHIHIDPNDLDWTPPRTKYENLISQIWCDVLGLEAMGARPALGIHSRFLNLGGDSMLATQVASRINTSLGIDFPLYTLFETPTVATLAAAVEVLTWMQTEGNQDEFGQSGVGPDNNIEI